MQFTSTQAYNSYMFPSAPSAVPTDSNQAGQYPQATPIYSTQFPQNFSMPTYTAQGSSLLGVPKAIHDKTLDLLAKAREMSETILYGKAHKTPAFNAQFAQPSVRSNLPLNLNVDLSDRSWRMFNNETHVHHHHTENESSQKKEDSKNRIWIGIIGVVVAGVAAFFIGKSVAQGEEIEEENQSFEDLVANWNSHKNLYDTEYRTTVTTIIGKTDVLMKRKETNRIHNIALIALSFTTGGAAVTGALLGSNAITTAAIGLGVVVSLATLFKAGHAYFSTRDQKDAQTIANLLTTLSS